MARSRGGEPYNQRPPRGRGERDPYRRRPRERARDESRYYEEDARVPVSSGRGGMSFSASVVAALFFGFVLVYMAWSAYGFFQPSVLTEVVRMDSMEMQTFVPGMIIRYEQVFYAPKAGHAVPIVGDFERVRAGDVVFRIQDVEALNRNAQSLTHVEEQIIELHEMRYNTVSDPAIAQINTTLLTMMDRNIHHFSQSNVQEVYSLLDRLNQVTNNRNQIKINETRGARADLAREFDILTQHNEAISYNMYAGKSGNMSPFIDPFVGDFTPHDLRILNREQINMTVDHTAIIPLREVEPGDPVFKIAGNTWYVVSFMPTEMVLAFEVGQERTIFLENANTGTFEPVPMRIQSIDHYHNYRRIVFRSNRYAINFLNQRNVNIRTTNNVQSGLKIPVSAITQRRFFRIPLTHLHQSHAGDYYVMRRGTYEDGFRQIFVDVYNESSIHAYIAFDNGAALRVNDILSPVNISEDGHYFLTEDDINIIRGVFRTNLGFADFSQIHIDGAILEYDTHIILDPARNPNIRLFDTIVTDASTVRQGQVIS